MLIVDFETRSHCDLIKKGAYNYALDITTEPLCCAFIDVDSDNEWLWTPKNPLPDELREQIKNADCIAAHNAQFDRLIWEYIAEHYYNFPHVPLEKWYCTSAQCRVNGLPANLEDAARALDTSHKKDPRGSQLIKLLCIPGADGSFNENPSLLDELYAYCLQDARTTKDVVLATRIMTAQEREDWFESEVINDRGILVDVMLADHAQRYANDEYIAIANQLSKDSGGVITKHTQTVRAAKWVAEQLGEDHPALPLMQVWKRDELKLTLDKNARDELLSGDENGDFVLPDAVFNVLTLLEEGSQSSVAKFKAMIERADYETDRVYGAFIYAGASQTLRFSSRGLQIHNMPQRGGFKTFEEANEAYLDIMAGKELKDATMPTLKKLLRFAIKADRNKKLVVGDWSGIEARILPWLSASKGGTDKLTMIAEGVDVYAVAAENIGHPGFRDLGKVMELACGYGGSVGAFKQFAKSFGLPLMQDYEIRDLVYTWRDSNAWVVNFWRALEGAAIAAINNPDTAYQVGRVNFYFASKLMHGSLLIILPNDSMLTYPKARVDIIDNQPVITALKASVKMRADAKIWPREQLYGGKIAGHVTQGTAGGLLRDLLLRVDDCIGHMHDEVILEVAAADAEERCENLKWEMEFPPIWAHGLPLKAEPKIMDRYGK